jgi:hypothetical protein
MTEGYGLIWDSKNIHLSIIAIHHLKFIIFFASSSNPEKS